MKKLLLIIFLCPQLLIAQPSDCLNAEAFCTGTAIGFPASINTTAPIGPDYGCLGSQPNPAYYFLQISQPGDLTINMQSTPLVDIDFICWGPFNDPTTMCDSLTGTYIVDCSYSTAPIEDCDITNAIVGQYYILLITNYSNVNCNIDFDQIGSGTGATSCCIDGDAGLDNSVSFCETDGAFILETQLNGTPSPSGTWYDDSWNIVNSNFDPSLLISGTFTYIVQGIPVAGSTVTCPDDTALLIINSNPNPLINFPVLTDLCSDDLPITLTANPLGGTYEGNGVSGNIFTPSVSVIGNNIITYSITDANNCSDTVTQAIKVNELPIVSLGIDIITPCNTSTLIDPLVFGGTVPYSYLWDTGDTDSMTVLSAGVYSLVVADFFGCSDADTLEISSDLPPSIELGVDLIIACNSNILIDPLVFGGTAPYSYLWNSGDTDSMTILSSGVYSVVVTDFAGCSNADTLEITYDAPPAIELGDDYNIACNTTTTLSVSIVGGTQPYSYLWNNGLTDLSIDISEGSYTLTVTDTYGCFDSDSIDIIEDVPGTVTVIGGEQICYGESSMITFDFNGLLPWGLVFSDGDINRSIPLINSSNFIHATSEDGLYSVVEAKDINGCVAANIGSAEIIVHPLPAPIIAPEFYEVYAGEEILLSVGNYAYYWWYSANDSLLSEDEYLVADSSLITYIIVEDDKGCIGSSENAIVNYIPRVELYIPNTFTPNGDEYNDLLVTMGNKIEIFKMMITNRWGDIVYTTNNINKYWDGKFKGIAVSQGVYSYQVDIIGKDKRRFNTTGQVQVIY